LRTNFDKFVLHLNSMLEKPQVIVSFEIWICDFEVAAYQL
jgi:hypothetical protein